MRLDRGGTTHDLGTTDGHALVAGLDPASRPRWRSAGAAARRRTVRRPAAPSALATDVGTAGGRSLVAASSRLLLLAAATTRARELVWLEGGGTRGPVASERGDYWQVRVSPDDRAAAVTMLEPQLRTLDVFVQPLVPGAVATGLSLALAADTDPVWSPDGRRVLFRSLLDGQPQLLSRAAGTPGADVEPRLPAGHGRGANRLARHGHRERGALSWPRRARRHRCDPAPAPKPRLAHDRRLRLQRVRRPLVVRPALAGVRVGRVRTARCVRPAVAGRRPRARDRCGRPQAAMGRRARHALLPPRRRHHAGDRERWRDAVGVGAGGGRACARHPRLRRRASQPASVGGPARARRPPRGGAGPRRLADAPVPGP